MSKEKDIKNMLYWVVSRGYAPILENPEQKAEGFVCDFKGKTAGFTQLFSVAGEEILQSGKFCTVDEVYYQYINEPRL